MSTVHYDKSWSTQWPIVHAIMKTQIAPHGMIVSLQITAQNIINDNKFHKLHIIQTQI